MTITTKRSLIALLLSLVLVVSLFTVGFSATEATGAVTTETVTEVVEETHAATEDSSETEAAKAETETEEVDTTAVDNAKRILIINAIIIAAIIVILVVAFIKFRVKLVEFFRSVKSELKKIVWSSKDQTRKGFLVVLVVTVSVAVVLLLIDLAFQEGISYLAKIFR